MAFLNEKDNLRSLCATMPVPLQQAEIDRWLSGKMEASELHPASETALREWPIGRRVSKADVGDDDPMVLEPIESNLL
jgi:putative SOS response-associated peptidase YedK